MNSYEELVVSPLLKDSLLARGSHRALARLLPHVTERHFRLGETLYRAGEPADYLYLLIDGEVVLTTPAATKILPAGRGGGVAAATSEVDTPPRRITVTSGRFGEEAGTDSAEYLAEATAATPVHALLLPRSHLSLLAADDPQLRSEFYFSLINQFSSDTVVRSRAAAPPRPRQAADDWQRTAGWLAAILLPLAVMLAGAQFGLDPNHTAFLAVLAATIVMWVFGLVDEYVPGLFALFAVVTLGLVPVPVALSGFASDSFFMAMSVLGLGTVIVASGLSYRLLLWLLLRLPNSPFWHSVGLLLTGFALTPLVPSINGRVALTAPFVVDMIDILNFPRAGKAATRLCAASFAGAGLLSAVFMSSKSVNFIVFGLLPAQTQDQFQWLNWFAASAFTGALLIALYLLLATVFFRGAETARLSKEQVAAQLGLLGSMKKREKAAIGGIALFMAGVASATLHNIPPPWLALAILYALLVFGFLIKREFREKTDWPFLVYLGGIAGITAAFNEVGLNKWLAVHLAVFGHYLQASFTGFVGLLAGIIFLIRLVVPISVTIVIMATVFMPLAEAYGVNSWVVGFVILVLGEMWFLPYQCSYYIQFRDIARAQDAYDERSFLLFNLLMNGARLAAVLASIPVWRAAGLL